MTYTPERQYLEELEIETIPPQEWAYLTRTEKQVRPLVVSGVDCWFLLFTIVRLIDLTLLLDDNANGRYVILSPFV